MVESVIHRREKRFVYLLMSRKYKFHDNDKLCFISFATVLRIDVFETFGI